MSYVIDEPSKHWLVIDDNGRIVAICATAAIADKLTDLIGGWVDCARKGDWMVGDVLPLFHV